MLQQQFIDWFRSASPYIHAHRGHTFVICFDGEAVQDHKFSNLIHDIALLSSLGIRLVLVHGIRPQIEQGLQVHGKKSKYVNNIRITDEMALKCVKAACGEVRADIESLLSMGLTNSPTTGFSIYTTSGNFITARPIGVRDGVDFLYTGEIRYIDVATITQRLDSGCIVLVSPLGYSPTGETFNLLTEEVAAAVAIGLKTTKLIYLIEDEGLFTNNGQLLRQLTLPEAQNHPNYNNQLKNAVRACQNGVERVHLLSRHIEGALLLELFTRDGIGTLVSTNPYENIRKATIDDVGGILELIKPLEEAGILVRRSREKLEMEIEYFTVQERDGMVVACAALYPFMDVAELACLAVDDHYRGTDRGGTLLTFLEQKARQLKIKKIFVLTTQTAHWFQERGFKIADLQSLPIERQKMYNYQRQAKVFIKQI